MNIIQRVKNFQKKWKKKPEGHVHFQIAYVKLRQHKLESKTLMVLSYGMTLVKFAMEREGLMKIQL